MGVNRKIPALIGAFLTLSVVYAVAGFAWGELLAEGAPREPPVLPIVGFAISNGLYVLFFSWVAEQMDHALKAALTVAISQLLLVDVRYVLDGSRGVTSAAVSAAVLVVAWSLVGVVYQGLMRQRG